MNKILSEIILISNKYSSIEEYLNSSNLNTELMKLNVIDKPSTFDSSEEN